MGREKYGIQRKLIFIIVIITSLTLFVFGLYSYFTFRLDQERELNKQADRISRRLLRSLTYPIWQFDTEFVNGVLDSEMDDENVYAIVIWNDDHTIQDFSRIKDASWKVRKRYVSNEERNDTSLIFISEDIVYMDNKIGILELFITKRIINEKINGEMIKVLIQIIVVDILLIIFIYFILYQMINVPIQKLIAVTEEIGKGNLDSSITLRSNNEFSTLGKAFNTMMGKLKNSTRELREKERLKKEMEIAEKIQRSLLPRIPMHEDLEITTIMKPAATIGGDYYDILFDSAGNLWFSIGDVSGRGLTPGLIMMMAETSILHSLKYRQELSPGQIAAWVNKTLFENVKSRLDEEYLMSLLLIKYEGKGRFVHAGTHIDIIVYRHASKECELVETTGAYLAIKDDMEGYYTDRQFILERDDFFVLITDGVIEARNSEGKFFDLPGVCSVIKKFSTSPIHIIKQRILETVMVWCNYQQKDDITINIIKRKK